MITLVGKSFNIYRLTEKEISIDNLGTIIPAGHLIGSMKDFFKK